MLATAADWLRVRGQYAWDYIAVWSMYQWLSTEESGVQDEADSLLRGEGVDSTKQLCDHPAPL